MLKKLLFSCLLFCFQTLFAQNEKFELVQEVYRQWQKFEFNSRGQCNYLYINDSLIPEAIKGLKERLSEQKKYYCVDGVTLNVDSFEFDDSELEYITKEADRLNSHHWPEKIFPNAKIVHPGQFEKHFKSTELLEPMEKFCYNVYTISNPIFLRNQTVCLFYNEERTFYNMSGEFSLYVYRKKKWELFSLICKHREVHYGESKKPTN